MAEIISSEFKAYDEKLNLKLDQLYIEKNGKYYKLSDLVIFVDNPSKNYRAIRSYDDFKKKDVVVIGISRDNVASHQKFAQKYNLPFIILSDPELYAIQAYGVWQEKKLYGKTSMGVVRTTFIIDENGFIEKIMPKVKPDTNAAEILDYLNG